MRGGILDITPCVNHIWKQIVMSGLSITSFSLSSKRTIEALELKGLVIHPVHPSLLGSAGQHWGSTGGWEGGRGAFLGGVVWFGVVTAQCDMWRTCTVNSGHSTPWLDMASRRATVKCDSCSKACLSR